nr:hypothetical protein [Tanacetum cinerariifolium]
THWDYDPEKLWCCSGFTGASFTQRNVSMVPFIGSPEACASRAVATLSATSFLMATRVMADASDVDVLLEEKMIEPKKPLKKKDQIMIDERIVRNLEAQLQAELEEEERLARKNEEEATIALIAE